MNEESEQKMAAVRIEVEITIGASRTRVWDALVHEIGQWWPKEFHALEHTRQFSLEPRLGGRMFEDAGDGAGVLWYTVVGYDPPSNMSLAGHLVPPYAGPATTLLRLQLSDSDAGGAVLRITDSVVGLVDKNAAESMRDGWKAVFEGGLKAHVESATEPD